jgi:hypothetical protein
MRIMRQYKPGRYSLTWSNLVYEEADGPYKFNVYFYKTGLYYSDYVSSTALLAPKHIIELVEEKVETGEFVSLEDWTPCDSPYSELTGEDPPEKYPFMTQLVGCGPWVFNYYDRSLAVGQVNRYEEFIVTSPVIAGAWSEWRIDPDTAFTYTPMIHNWGAAENSENGTLTSMTVDVKVYEDDVLAHEEFDLTLAPWDWTYLGPFTTDPVAVGEHAIKIEIYDSEDDTLIFTYTHRFVATVRTDINTYRGEVLDFKVNIADIFAAARAFGSTAEDAAQATPAGLRWNPDADVNDDFAVDIRDIFFIARDFGWSG